MQFLTYPGPQLPPLEGYILLDIEGVPLTKEDAGRGLLLLDATWRYAAKMRQWLGERPEMVMRSLPADLVTAYPRKQDDCPDPSRGLASVEALAAAYQVLGRDGISLLNNYYWKKSFLNLNQGF